MTSSVPSVEDFTNAFPTQVTPIVGEPTYATLKTLKDQLKANAASVPTTLGGGNHGYLGLILPLRPTPPSLQLLSSNPPTLGCLGSVTFDE